MYYCSPFSGSGRCIHIHTMHVHSIAYQCTHIDHWSSLVLPPLPWRCLRKGVPNHRRKMAKPWANSFILVHDTRAILQPVIAASISALRRYPLLDLSGYSRYGFILAIVVDWSLFSGQIQPTDWRSILNRRREEILIVGCRHCLLCVVVLDGKKRVP